MYLAKNSSINIYADGPCSAGDSGEGMSLKEIIEKKQTPSTDDVRNTRKKIGLGKFTSEAKKTKS